MVSIFLWFLLVYLLWITGLTLLTRLIAGHKWWQWE